jgi:hypothetical protein
VAALILAFAPDMVSVFITQVLQGATAGIITPAIRFVRPDRDWSRRNVGAHRTEFSLFRRRPRADRRADGRCGGLYCAKGAIFIAAAALCIPALIALSFIRSNEIDYARARNAKSAKQSDPKGFGQM